MWNIEKFWQIAISKKTFVMPMLSGNLLLTVEAIEKRDIRYTVYRNLIKHEILYAQRSFQWRQIRLAIYFSLLLLFLFFHYVEFDVPSSLVNLSSRLSSFPAYTSNRINPRSWHPTPRFESPSHTGNLSSHECEMFATSQWDVTGSPPLHQYKYVVYIRKKDYFLCQSTLKL